jgi:hypothetical protein
MLKAEANLREAKIDEQYRRATQHQKRCRSHKSWILILLIPVFIV